MSTFTPEPYDPPAVLDMLHNGPRARGTNEINIDINNLSAENESVDYLIGVATVPIVLVVVFVVWVFALCCVGCCRRRCSCGNFTAGVLFTGFMLLSAFGWFYSIGGNGQATGGVETLLDQVDAVSSLVDNTVADIDGALGFLNTLGSSVSTAANNCVNLTALAGVTFPEANLTGFTTDIQTEFNSIKAELQGVQGDIVEAVDTVEPFLTEWRTAYTILVATIIVLISVFTLATLWRIVPNVPGRDSCCAKALSKLSGGLFLTVGVLLLVLIWIVIFILALISTAGADLCLPSPTDNLLRVIDQALDRGSTTPICDEEPYSYICFYADCVGPNPLLSQFDVTGLINDNLTDAINDILIELNDTVTSIPSGSPSLPSQADIDTCLGGIIDLNEDAGGVDDVLSDVTDVVECESINPIYTGTVNEGLCEGVVAGIGVTWITMAVGSLSLMAGMLVYRVFEFDRYEYGEYVEPPEAQVVNYGGDKGGAVVSPEK